MGEQLKINRDKAKARTHKTKGTKSFIKEAETSLNKKKFESRSFHDIFQQYYLEVYSHCLRMTGSPANSEDLTQQVFLQVKNEFNSLNNRTSLNTHLYKIMTQQLLSYFSNRGGSNRSGSGLTSRLNFENIK